MGDYFSLPNYLADVNPPTKKTEKLLQELENMHTDVRNYNNSKANEKPILGKIKRFCGLCESELIKSKKGEKLEGLDIEIPRYKCKMCSQVYSGIGLNLTTPNGKVKAICFPLEEGL